MKSPVTNAELTELLGGLYRPSPRGHWQRRVQTLVGEWLGRPDARIAWSPGEEFDDDSPVRVPIPNREHAPRWIGFDRPLSARAGRVASVIVGHLAVVADLMSRHASPGDRAVPTRWTHLLTARQMDVAVLAAAGRQNKEIADDLGIAPRTVARTLQEAYQRLSLNSRAELAVECAIGRPPTPVELRVLTPAPIHPDDT